MNMVDHSTANYHAQTPKLELPTRTARHLATQTEGWYKMPPPKTGFAIITWNNPKKFEKPWITKGF